MTANLIDLSNLVPPPPLFINIFNLLTLIGSQVLSYFVLAIFQDFGRCASQIMVDLPDFCSTLP